MNREEAIKWLKIKRECYDYEGMSCEKPMDAGLEIGCGYCEEAIDMAIEALQGGDAMRNDRTYINEPYMQQSRHDDGRMTREQAVKWVKFVHDVLYEDKDEEIRKALNMAIEALSEPNVVRCGECEYSQEYTAVTGETLIECRQADFDGLLHKNDYCSHGERQCNYFGERREP